jgi:hypothetical protein
MVDARTIASLESERYHWITCECCNGTVRVPFRMIRAKFPGLGAMTLDQIGARMRCEVCGQRPARYYPARMDDAPGYARSL